MFTIEKMDTLNFGGYGVELKVQIKTKRMRKIPDIITLHDGRTLNVILKGCLPLCHRCAT